jgi:hypothetical protein
MCGARGTLTREDVISGWIKEVLAELHPPTGRVRITRNVTQQGHYLGFAQTVKGAVNAYKLRVVCSERCNGGWMSRLENETKTILAPLILGQRRSLTRKDQEVVARWLRLKSLFFDLNDPGHRIFTSEDFEEFFRHPDASSVWGAWLGRYDAAVSLDQSMHVRAPILTSRPYEGRPAESPYALQLTLVFGRLVLQSVVIAKAASSYPDVLKMAASSPHALAIWPIVHSEANWPPPLPLTERNIEQFAAVNTPGALVGPPAGPEGTPHIGSLSQDS